MVNTKPTFKQQAKFVVIFLKLHEQEDYDPRAGEELWFLLTTVFLPRGNVEKRWPLLARGGARVATTTDSIGLCFGTMVGYSITHELGRTQSKKVC